MFANFVAAVKRYSGYTRFVSPYWQMYLDWLVAHPRTTGVMLIALFLFGVR